MWFVSVFGFNGISTIKMDTCPLWTSKLLLEMLSAEQGKRNAKEVDQAMKLNRNSIANEGKDQQQKYLKLKYSKMVSAIFPYSVIHKDGVNSLITKKRHL
jgi:undecaprenyl pyrophosphate synthase